MSLTSGTLNECFYSSWVTGTQLNTFTTEDNLMKTLPVCKIPAGFFPPTLGLGKALKVKASGRLGTTGTPTFTMSLRFLTSQTWSAAGIGFSTAAITAGSGVTLAQWFLEVDIVMRIMLPGAASTIMVNGEFRSGTGFAAGGGIYTLPGANVTNVAATYDTQLDNFLFLSAACGTNNALNLIQLESLKVYGEN